MPKHYFDTAQEAVSAKVAGKRIQVASELAKQDMMKAVNKATTETAVAEAQKKFRDRLNYIASGNADSVIKDLRGPAEISKRKK